MARLMVPKVVAPYRLGGPSGHPIRDSVEALRAWRRP
jgi:hypothetical protein